MKLIKPSFSLIHQLFITDFIDEDTTADMVQDNLIDNLMKHIEVVGRTCYKSEDKITEDSYLRFINILKKGQHYAMFEHGTVYLTIPKKDLGEEINKQSVLLLNNKYSKYTEDSEKLYITTNFRVIVENDLFPIMEYITYPTKHLRRITVKFILSRATANEFVRHRIFSFAQESTRYCNYTMGKFGNQLTFILPPWIKNIKEGEYLSYGENPCSKDTNEDNWFDLCMCSEISYEDMIKKGWKPEEARDILPQCLKTELIMTGFIDDFDHFFNLRAKGTTGKPHPAAAELAIPLMEVFEEIKNCKSN